MDLLNYLNWKGNIRLVCRETELKKSMTLPLKNMFLQQILKSFLSIRIHHGVSEVFHHHTYLGRHSNFPVFLPRNVADPKNRHQLKQHPLVIKKLVVMNMCNFRDRWDRSLFHVWNISFRWFFSPKGEGRTLVSSVLYRLK